MTAQAIQDTAAYLRARGYEDAMTAQDIQDAVAFLRMRGHTADLTGPDQWHVRITFPHFPQLTIDEQMPSRLLVAVSNALRPFSHPVPRAVSP